MLLLPKEITYQDFLRGPDLNNSPWLVPICDATARGVRFQIIPPNLGRFHCNSIERKTVSIVGDDSTVALGPKGFHGKSIKRLLQSAHAIALITCAAQSDIYRCAAIGAELGGHFVIVESRTEFEAEWIEVIEPHRSHASILLAIVKPEGSA